jgi:hypothetical protein
MEHVAVALHFHVLGHGHTSGPSHSTQVVAPQINEHHVLGPFLGVALQRVGESVVLGRCGAARPRAGNRVSGHAIALDTDEKFRARAHDRELRHAHEEQVRAGVDSPQRSVQRYGTEPLAADDRPLEGLAARHDDLDRLPGGDRLFGGPDRRLVSGPRLQAYLDLI